MTDQEFEIIAMTYIMSLNNEYTIMVYDRAGVNLEIIDMMVGSEYAILENGRTVNMRKCSRTMFTLVKSPPAPIEEVKVNVVIAQ